jgi:hypothetical protein
MCRFERQQRRLKRLRSTTRARTGLTISALRTGRERRQPTSGGKPVDATRELTRPWPPAGTLRRSCRETRVPPLCSNRAHQFRIALPVSIDSSVRTRTHHPAQSARSACRDTIDPTNGPIPALPGTWNCQAHGRPVEPPPARPRDSSGNHMGRRPRIRTALSLGDDNRRLTSGRCAA